MKEFRIVIGTDTVELQANLNKAAKEGFDLVPHKKIQSGQSGFNGVFIAFMERTIPAVSPDEIRGIVEK